MIIKANIINKVIYGGNTLIDLTSDTVTASDILTGVTAHDKSGAIITGTCSYDANTSNDMPNNGSVTGTITTKAGQYTIPSGYHDGGGKVGISSTEQNKIIASNIKSGISILGVTGTYSGEAVTVQSKTATPSTSQQVILPDQNYDYLSQVTVNAIPYTETLNSAGGYTAEIG